MDVKQIRRQALDEKTLPNTLAELAKRKDCLTRKYVASNPNTPVGILERLACEFPEAIMANPILDLLIFDNPGRLSTIHANVVSNPNTPTKIIEDILSCLLSNSKDELVLELTDGNYDTPVENLNFSRINIKRSISFDRMALEAIARHPNTSARILDYLLENSNDIYLIYGVLRNRNTPSKTLTPLAKHKNEIVRQYVARHLNTPEKILFCLANDEDVKTRQCVAQNPNTPYIVLDYLKRDCDKVVRLYAISNKK